MWFNYILKYLFHNTCKDVSSRFLIICNIYLAHMYMCCILCIIVIIDNTGATMGIIGNVPNIFMCCSLISDAVLLSSTKNICQIWFVMSHPYIPKFALHMIINTRRYVTSGEGMKKW